MVTLLQMGCRLGGTLDEVLVVEVAKKVPSGPSLRREVLRWTGRKWLRRLRSIRRG